MSVCGCVYADDDVHGVWVVLEVVFCFFGVFWCLASYDHWGVEFVC